MPRVNAGETFFSSKKALKSGSSMASLYREAACVLERVESGKSVKAAAMSTAGESKNPRRCLALVSGVVSQRRAVESAMRDTGTWKALEGQGIGRSKRCLVLVAAYDMMAGQGLPKKRKAGGKLLGVLRSHEMKLSSAFKRNGGIRSDEQKKKQANESNDQRRRFARVNPLAGATASTVKTELTQLLNETNTQILNDSDVVNLLEFPPSLATVLNASHSLVTSGQVILQDKSSCFPAQALIGEDWNGGDILDCCAAPGNKSTHLAALLHSHAKQGSRVIALDRDPERLHILQRRIMEARAADTVETRLLDCLRLEADDIPNVKAVLLDPSCSGSGIPGSSMRTLKPERLQALAAFQVTALTTFLTRFPQVDRLVYSTCSVHDLENEDVVAKALLATQGTFELVHCLPSWSRRGRATPAGLSEHLAARCLRVDPQLDNMTGFFVALFQRVRKEEHHTEATADHQDRHRQEQRNRKRKLKRANKRRARQADASHPSNRILHDEGDTPPSLDSAPEESSHFTTLTTRGIIPPKKRRRK